MSHSTISLGLGLGGGKSATSSGSSGGGGGTPFTNELSASFDGSYDFIDVGDDSSLAPSNLTLSCWFKASGSIAGLNYLISRNGNTYGAYHLRYTNANKFNYFIGFAPGGGTHRQASFNTAFTLTDWHHVALTYDGSYIKGYVDGSEDYSIAETRAIAYAADAVYGTDTWIGKSKFASPAEGLMDEVAVFNSALSAADISTLRGGASAGSLGEPTDISSLNPVSWWRMGDGVGDVNAAGGAPANGGAIGTIVNAATGSNSGGTAINGTQTSVTAQPTFSTVVP